MSHLWSSKLSITPFTSAANRQMNHHSDMKTLITNQNKQQSTLESGDLIGWRPLKYRWRLYALRHQRFHCSIFEFLLNSFMVNIPSIILRAWNSNRRIVKMTFVLTKAFERTCHSSGKWLYIKNMSCTPLYKCEPNVNHRNRVQA